MNAWKRTRAKRRAHHAVLLRSAEAMRPLERLALLCDLATSSDADARLRARALLARFPDTPGGRWIAEHLDTPWPAATENPPCAAAGLDPV